MSFFSIPARVAGLALVVLTSACSESPGSLEFDTEIRPGKIFEECFGMAAAETLTYEFTADGELGFNLHYHEGDQVTYPIKKKARQDQGEFVADRDFSYCLMWTNRGQDAVQLRGGFSISADPR